MPDSADDWSALLRGITIDIPFPTACHPSVAEAEARGRQWAERHGLVRSDEARTRLHRGRFGQLAGRAYPAAGAALFQTTVDLMMWLFTYDDDYVDRTAPQAARTVPAIAGAVNVLDRVQGDGVAPPFETAFEDICGRLREQLTAEQFARFANGIRLALLAAPVQNYRRAAAQPLTLSEYEVIRRYLGGCPPCFALIDAANGDALPAAEYEHPDLQQLTLHANNVVCWTNDIYSLAMEHSQPGRFWNMPLVYAAHGCTPAQALARTAERVHEEVASFAELAAHVTSRGSTAQRRYVQGLGTWIRALYDWTINDTARYAPHYEPDGVST
ncbi:sesquiterpene cyclase [Streptomyces sp. NPDC005989]|uniref:terpene synthase family protein n=1 Tax=Streptomyces sp. NPDC005989 TaxID=3156727 RepID=UPI0033F33C1F